MKGPDKVKAFLAALSARSVCWRTIAWSVHAHDHLTWVVDDLRELASTHLPVLSFGPRQRWLSEETWDLMCERKFHNAVTDTAAGNCVRARTRAICSYGSMRRPPVVDACRVWARS
mgnify:CR=1 FL=1